MLWIVVEVLITIQYQRWMIWTKNECFRDFYLRRKRTEIVLFGLSVIKMHWIIFEDERILIVRLSMKSIWPSLKTRYDDNTMRMSSLINIDWTEIWVSMKFINRIRLIFFSGINYATLFEALHCWSHRVRCVEFWKFVQVSRCFLHNFYSSIQTQTQDDFFMVSFIIRKDWLRNRPGISVLRWRSLKNSKTEQYYNNTGGLCSSRYTEKKFFYYRYQCF